MFDETLHKDASNWTKSWAHGKQVQMFDDVCHNLAHCYESPECQMEIGSTAATSPAAGLKEELVFVWVGVGDCLQQMCRREVICKLTTGEHSGPWGWRANESGA